MLLTDEQAYDVILLSQFLDCGTAEALRHKFPDGSYSLDQSTMEGFENDLTLFVAAAKIKLEEQKRTGIRSGSITYAEVNALARKTK